MKQSSRQYIPSFQVERFFKGVRYHWMICCEHKPDVLVAWGHAPTRELAEEAARNEINDLSLGISKGGRATKTATTINSGFLSRMAGENKAEHHSPSPENPQSGGKR